MTAATGVCQDGSLRSPDGDSRGLRTTQASAGLTTGPTSLRLHLTRPGVTPLGQVNPLAPAATGIHQGVPGPAPMGRQPPRSHSTPRHPPTNSLAGPPAIRAMVLGEMAQAPRWAPTANPAAGPRSWRGRQLEAGQDAVPGISPALRGPIQGPKQHLNADAHR